MPRADPLSDPLTVARRAQLPAAPVQIPPPVQTPAPVQKPPAAPVAAAGTATTATRPTGRRIAPPEARLPDGPLTGSMTETGSHARIMEPIADPPAPAKVAAVATPPVTKPPVAKPPRVKPVKVPKVKTPKVREPKVKAPVVEPPAKVAEPAPQSRRAEPRPKVERAKVDRTVAREKARANRAATAAPAARAAAATPRTTAPPLTAAERRAQLRERVGATRTTAIAENESWMMVLLLGAITVALGRLGPDLPELVSNFGGVLVSSALAWGLAVRTGGRPIWAAALAASLGAAAVVTQWASLMSGAALGTAVLAATLALMLTIPAATFGLAIREVLIATAIAWVGGVGVVGYGDHDTLDVGRFGYVVFGLSLVAAFSLVYRLGAGLHGLGRRGYAVAGGAVLMLVVALAYTEAISQWGSRDLVDSLDEVRSWLRSTFGAVAHPIMALLGYPALVWGVFMRARRRQGWWVCAFGVAATASSATRLIAEDLGVRSIVLGEAYSLIVGLALGYLAIRLEQSFTGSHGRRARRDEEAVAHRPEPRRTRALH